MKYGLSTTQILITIIGFICFSLKPVGLIMWDQFIANESTTILEVINRKLVIIAMRLKVVSHNGKRFPKSFFFINLKHLLHKIFIFIVGISLSTEPSSSFITNPNHFKATALEEW